MSYGKARAPTRPEAAPAFLARDEFDQSAGNLTGKTLPVGGTWEGAGDADDFDIYTASNYARRTAVSDPNTGDVEAEGRLCTASAPTLANVLVQADAWWTLDAGNPAVGVIARFADDDNFISAYFEHDPNFLSVFVAKHVAGTRTQLAADLGGVSGGQESTWWRIRLTVDAGGNWSVWIWEP